MHVVVTDKSGEPVKDLTSADFTVTDDGHRQKVQLFVQDTNEPLPPPAQPLPPNTNTNQILQQPGAAQNVTVVLLDGLNTDSDDQAYAKKLAVKFLRQVKPQDRYAIYTLGHDLRVLQDFTGNSSAPSTPAQFQAGDARTDAILADTFQRDADYGIQVRVNLTSKALVAISNHLSALPGRKNLLWVSGSFPFSVRPEDVADTEKMAAHVTAPGSSELVPLQLEEQVAKAAEALDSADLAVYPVDATGRAFGEAPQHGGAGSGTNINRMSLPKDNQGTNYTKLDIMDELARRTGGKAFYNTSDITVSLRDAIADSRLTYDIGYYPENVKWDDGFHRVDVKVSRPDVSVRTREGYYAALSPTVKPDALQIAVTAAAQSPLDATKIPLTVRVVPTDAAAAFGGTPRGLNVSFDPKSIYFENADGKYTGTFEIAYVQLDDTGKIIRGKEKVFPLSLSPDQYAQFSNNQVEVTETLWILPATTHFRVILSDASTGNVGSVTVPIATPNAKE